MSTITGIRGVFIAKRRTIVTFGLAFWSSHLKGVNNHRKRGKRREEREREREERRERGEKREERREERGEKRKERREREERREERREVRGERREVRGERRGERREEKREKRREDDLGPTIPVWCRVWGVIISAVYVSRVCIRVRGSHQVGYMEYEHDRVLIETIPTHKGLVLTGVIEIEGGNPEGYRTQH